MHLRGESSSVVILEVIQTSDISEDSEAIRQDDSFSLGDVW